MVIDVHAHIFPEKIAAKASAGIGRFYGSQGLVMRWDGGVSPLLNEKWGIDRFLVHSVATSPAQIHSVNTFLAGTMKEHPETFIAFGSLHPDMDDPDAGVDEIIESGLLGVKLHPDMQAFAVDSPASVRLIKAIEGRLPLLLHAGDCRYAYSNPAQIRRMLDEAPSLTLMAAHFGGYSMWNEADELLAGLKNVYVDCSSSMFAMTDEEIVRRIRRFGADHVMFGSDYPMWTPGDELERVMNLPLHDDEREQVLHLTAETVLNLK